MTRTALVGARVFDGQDLLDNRAVLIVGDMPQVVPADSLAATTAIRDLAGGVISPGFVDLQVNGGGGLMFNDAPSLATLRIMTEAHRTLGTLGFLPTLITDTPDKTRAAIAAATEACEEGVSGVLGLHLEGPHLDPRRKGAHDATLIRPMTQDDLDLLCTAAGRLPNLMITVAPESVTLDQIRKLRSAGAIVSLGHSACRYETAMAAIEAGAACVTHLFNAMSQLGSREPGLVGAALDSPVAAGIIADGIHVDPATLRLACAAKSGNGDLFLVTDAMATAGSEITTFTLNGRSIGRNHGRLTLADGTLAGANLSMAQAVQVMTDAVGEPLARALARATSIPAAQLRRPKGTGSWPKTTAGLIHIEPGGRARPLTDLL